MKNWIMTFSGVQFPLIKPKVEHFKLVDIAHALSLINRYNGHSKHRYSVGLHCLLGAEQMKKDGHSYLLQLYFMLHDASEAYYGDVTRPLKAILGKAYTDLEDYAMERIWEAFRLPEPTDEQWAIIKYYDDLVLGNEIPVLMPKADNYVGVELRDDNLGIKYENEKDVEDAFNHVVIALLARVIEREQISDSVGT